MADKIKIAVAVALLVAGIAAFYQWDQSPLIARVGAVIGGAVAAVVVFWTTAQGKEFFTFAQESVEETKRVVYQPVSIEPREITPRIIREDKYGGLQ